MAKAINAEFSDEDDEDNDNKSNWDDDEKVMFRCNASHILQFQRDSCKPIILLTIYLIIFLKLYEIRRAAT